MSAKQVSWNEFAARYVERQVSTVDELRGKLEIQMGMYKPLGFFIAQCQMLGSSRLGSMVVLPYGPNNTFKTVPDFAFSPRGLASDMSTAEFFVTIEDFIAGGPKPIPAGPRSFSAKDIDRTGSMPRITVDEKTELLIKEAAIAQYQPSYGSKLLTRYMIDFEGRFRRVYATCYSNAAWCWFVYNGERITVN